ncbi:MAG: MFS transporter [Nitrososphaerota archaeon]|nr:MFS transporter [Nitrososphaerota archaeon]
MKERLGSYIAALAILSASTFALRASTNMFSTNLPLVAREVFSFKSGIIGSLSGLVALAGFVSITFVNARMASKSRRRLFILSAFGYFLLFSFVALGGPLGIWFIAAAAGFLVQPIMTNQANASSIIGKTAPERERGIAVYTISLSASLVVGPLVNSLILTKVSLAESFVVFSIFPLTAALLSFLIPFPKDASTPLETKGDFRREDVHAPFKVGSFIKTMKNEGFQAAIFIMAMYSIPFTALVTFGGLFSMDYYAASNIAVQYYFAIFFTVSFAFRILLLFSRRANIRLLTAISTVFSILGIALLVTVINPWSYVIAMALLGIPHGLTYPSALIVISRTSSESERNTLNSYFTSFIMVVNVLTPILIGFIAELLSLRYAFSLLLSSILIFSFLIFGRLSSWNSL